MPGRRRPISGTYVKAQIPPPHEKPRLDVGLADRDPLCKPDVKEALKAAREVAKRDDAA